MAQSFDAVHGEPEGVDDVPKVVFRAATQRAGLKVPVAGSPGHVLTPLPGGRAVRSPNELQIRIDTIRPSSAWTSSREGQAIGGLGSFGGGEPPPFCRGLAPTGAAGLPIAPPGPEGRVPGKEH